VLNPDPVHNPTVNYVVLGAALVFESDSWFVALRGFQAEKGVRGDFQAVRESKDHSTFLVLFAKAASHCWVQ
jgi:hypothetical protein